MSTKFLSPGWRMPRNANQSKQASYSLHFTPGSVTNVNLGDALSFFIGSFSASMWVKSPDNGKEFFSRYISANGVGNFRIGCGANSGATANTVSLMTKNFLLSGSTDIRDGNWHHVCVTMDAISSTQYTRTIYVDGSQDAQDTVTLATYVSTSSSYGLNLGCNFQNNGHTLVDMSEVSIFDYALSPSQVTTLYGDSTNGSGNPMALPNPPKAYYPLGTSAWNGEYLAENNAIGDYVFDFIPNNYINLNSDILFNTNQGFSFSSWVNLDSYSDPYPYLANLKTNVTDGIGIFISNNSSYSGVNVGSTDSSITKGKTTGDISGTFLNSWNQVVVTYNGNGANTLSNFLIYVNGSPVTLTSTGTFGTMPNTANNIGRRSNSYHYLDGKISNVQIFNTSLSGTEVTTLYNNGSPIRILANIPQNSNLKAWYKLDASEVYNSSTTEWSIDNNQNPSAYASSLNFNGSSDYINFTGLPDFGGGSLTISFWIKSGVDAFNAYVLNRALSFYIFQVGITTNLRYRLQTSGLSSIDGGAILDNNWHHCVMTFNSSANEFKVFEDGSQIGSTVTTTGSLASSTAVINFLWNGGGYFKGGSFSNLSMWNAALTSAQITEIYNNGTPSNLSSHSATSNLVSWWKLNNTTTGIEDAKGSSSATNNGATEYPGFVNKLVGDSSGMSQANLVQSDLQTVAPYSKYAMNFDAADSDYINTNYNANLIGSSPQSFSMWFKSKSTGIQYKSLMGQYQENLLHGWGIEIGQPSNLDKITWYSRNSTIDRTSYGSALTQNQWYHLVVVINSASLNNVNYSIYLDGTPLVENATSSYYDNTSVLNSFKINNRYANSAYYGGGNFVISNASTWNTDLTSAQVTEIYNEGLPSNLNSHSAYSNLVSWWQLGENSSYTGDWIFADEKGTNNGEGQNLTEINLTNGVGTTANGVSSGMSEGNLVGDAPYSTANAISSGMSVVSRGTDVAPSPPPLLLDTYTGSAAAYSLRRLSNSYTGNLIRVTKKVSSVISTTDIGYNSSNELDTTALATFASGADDGEVKVDIWYDQSGNGNNVTQSSFTSCPNIYESGSILTSNGKPAIKTGVNVYLQTSNQPLSSTQQSGFFVGEPISKANYHNILGHGDYNIFWWNIANEIGIRMLSLDATSRIYAGNFIVGSSSLLSYYNNSSSLFLRQDGSQIGSRSVTPVSYGSKDVFIGHFGGGNVNKVFNGLNQEQIIFPSEQSSNLTGIETNIKNYHGI